MTGLRDWSYSYTSKLPSQPPPPLFFFNIRDLDFYIPQKKVSFNICFGK